MGLLRACAGGDRRRKTSAAELSSGLRVRFLALFGVARGMLMGERGAGKAWGWERGAVGSRRGGTVCAPALRPTSRERSQQIEEVWGGEDEREHFV